MRALSNVLFAAAISVAAAAAAPASAQSPAVDDRNFYFALFGGVTGGGDRIAEVNYSNGDRESIRAGGLVHLAAGVVWQSPQLPLSVQATVGWHADSISARNGDVTFYRWPIEVLGYWHGVPNWRLGGGARFVNGAKLESDVNGFSDTVSFKDTTGFVIEAGYRLGLRGWINLRYIDESYEAESFNGFIVTPTGKSSARSAGVNLVWMF
jgi:hypothetical protein